MDLIRGMRADAQKIIDYSIKSVLPEDSVRRALKDRSFRGRVFLVAIGKAAWRMGKAAREALIDQKIIPADGIVITKYDHVEGEIKGIRCFEAGHPIPDDNSYKATEEVLKMVQNLTSNDTVLFLISGGGSALFEKPLISPQETADITSQLMKCGASITEINTIRKRISAVKGGKFAKACEPAKVFSVVLSDIIGDPLDMIASGPAVPDSSSCKDALTIIDKYDLLLSPEALKLMEEETPKQIDNVETVVTGSVKLLCSAAADCCRNLGYMPVVLADNMDIEAYDAGVWLSGLALEDAPCGPTAYIAGGETVVHVRGNGKGGRNQELALAAAKEISGTNNAVIFSVGSDGTDGPTDAAGGMVDGGSWERIKGAGLDPDALLFNNDSYNALTASGDLVITGPTGTNVNDVTVVLVK